MTSLTLGDFVFARGEMPESIGFGAAQQLHVHTLIGGARVIDAMGAVPQRQEWSGWFSGPEALARARFLKQLTEAGQPLALRYGEFAYTVVIANFCAEFRAGPHLPYAIALEVVDDHGAARPGAGLPGLAQVIAQDLIGAADNAAAIGDAGLISVVGAVAAAVTDGGSDAPPSAAMQFSLSPIGAARTHAAGLDVAASAQISTLGPLSSPAAGSNPVSPEAIGQFGTGLAAAAAAVQQSFFLNATMQVLQRVSTNLSAGSGKTGAGGATLITGTGDLYHLAASAYGDARGWTRIAQANGLTDPVISGITQLVIPPASVSATGALNV